MKTPNPSSAGRSIMLLKEKTALVWTGMNERGADHPILLALAFFAVFLSMLAYNVQHVDSPFHHDSLRYWELGSSFYANGSFSFLNFSDQLRGYFFPFLLSVLQSQEGLLGLEARTWFLIYSALFFALFTMLLVPWFFEVVFGWKTPILGRLIFALLLFFFWRGHFLYPLTDFPALAAFLTGVTLLVYSTQPGKSPYWLVLAGLSIAAALNIRPAYQIAGLLVLVLFGVFWFRSGIRQLIVSMALFLLGCVPVLLPQWWINQNRFDSNSPFVLANYADDENLFQSQLFWGLKSQKYETNIGENYPGAAVVYSDPLAGKLPRNAMRDKSLGGYLKILQENPLDMTVSYVRHAFNGLDIFYPTPYVKNIFADHTLFSLFNYVLWFLFACFIFQLDFSKMDDVRLAAVAGLLAPVILAIPLVMEVRFFLPLYVLAYGVISFAAWNGGLFSLADRKPFHILRLLSAGVLWVMIFFTLSAATVEQLVLP